MATWALAMLVAAFLAVSRPVVGQGVGFLCDFENSDNCGQHLRLTEWQVGTGRYSLPTNRNNAGRFLYVNRYSSIDSYNLNVDIMSPLPDAIGPNCLKFKYVMYGEGIEFMKVVTPRSTLWEMRGDQSLLWHSVQLSVDDSPIRFEARKKYQDGAWGDFMLDDVELRRGDCTQQPQSSVQTTTTTTTPSPANWGPATGVPATVNQETNHDNVLCTFESSLCGLNMGQGDINFERRQGATPSDDTGPSGGHTSAGQPEGYYIYVEATNNFGKSARIYTNEFKESREHCLTFFYSMHGVDMGRLEVKDCTDLDTGYTLWKKEGPQTAPGGTSWIKGHVTLREYTKRICIDALIGPNYRSDIALDDFEIRPYRCTTDSSVGTSEPEPETETEPEPEGESESEPEPESESESEPEPEPNKPKHPNGIVSVSNFEAFNEIGQFNELNQGSNGMKKNWYNDVYDTTDFTTQKGPTPTPGTGPTQDHTTGEGNFIFLESSEKDPDENACIISATMDSGEHCVSLYYHMHGAHIGTLNVLSYPSKRVLYSITGDQGDEWKEAQVRLPSGVTQVMIEARSGSGHLGDIGVDDVVIYKGECPPPGTRPTPPKIPVPECSADDPFCKVPKDMVYAGLLDLRDWKFRLNGGDQPNIGRLELQNYQGTWGRVCGETFTDREARVICSMMGFYGPPRRFVTDDDRRPIRDRVQYPYTHVALADIRCGSAWVPSINYCCYNKPGVHACTGADDIYMECSTDNSEVAWLDYFDQCKRNGGNTNGCGPGEMIYAVDGPSWGTTCSGHRAGSCIPQPAPGFFKGNLLDDERIVEFECPFNSGFTDGNCAMVQDEKDDDFNFTITFGSTPTFGTGPNSDHTSGRGSYLYIEVDPNNQLLTPNWCAVILTGFYDADNTDYCLEFYYHMYGQDIHKILVFREKSTNLTLSTVVDKIAGNQGNQWHRRQVNYPARPGEQVRFVIAAIVGNGTRGDIALDDITLYRGRCDTDNQFPPNPYQP